MAMITVQVWDATGNKRQEVELPDDAPVNRILAVLVDKLNLPETGPDGQPLSYKFHHKASGKQLHEEQCLAEANVKEGDVLRLQPEITAGASSSLSERKSQVGRAMGILALCLIACGNPSEV